MVIPLQAFYSLKNKISKEKTPFHSRALLLLWLLLGISSSLCAQKIKIKTDESLTYGAGSTVGLMVNVSGSFASGSDSASKNKNIFSVELSDAQGNFSSQRVLATYAGYYLGSFQVVLPADVTTSTNYRLRMKATLGNVISDTVHIKVENKTFLVNKVTAADAEERDLNLNCMEGSHPEFGFINRSTGDKSSERRINITTSDPSATLSMKLFDANTAAETPLPMVGGGQFQIPEGLRVGHHHLLLTVQKEGVYSSFAYSFLFTTSLTGLTQNSSFHICLDDSVKADIQPFATNYKGSLYVVSFGDDTKQFYTHAQLIENPIVSKVYPNVSCGVAPSNRYELEIKIMAKSADACTKYKESNTPTRTFVDVAQQPSPDFQPKPSYCDTSKIVIVNKSTAGQYFDGNACVRDIMVRWEYRKWGSADAYTWGTADAATGNLSIPAGALSADCYEVKLMVSNPQGCTKRSEIVRKIMVEPVPVASFQSQPNVSEVCQGEKLALINQSNVLGKTCTNTEWLWRDTTKNGVTFVEGSPTSSEGVIQLDSAGPVVIQQTVTNACGPSSLAKNILVRGNPSVKVLPKKSICLNTPDTIIDFSQGDLKPLYSELALAPKAYAWSITSAHTAGQDYEFTTALNTPYPKIRFKKFGEYTLKIELESYCGAPVAEIFYVEILENPQFTLSPRDTTVCQGNAVTIVASNPNYSYSSNQGASFSTVSSWTYSVHQDSVYKVYAEQAGCRTFQTAQLRMNQKPSISNKSNLSWICSDSSVRFVPALSQPGTRMEWYRNTHDSLVPAQVASSAAQIVEVIKNKASSVVETYYYFRLDNNGCKNLDSIPLTILPEVYLIPPIDDKPALCSGERFVLKLEGQFNRLSETNSDKRTGIVLSGSGNQYHYDCYPTAYKNDPAPSNIVLTPEYVSYGRVCKGVPQSLVVTVNPIPRLSNRRRSICSGTLLQHKLVSLTPGTHFSWEIISHPQIEAAVFNGQKDSIIDVLKNNSPQEAIQRYKIFLDAHECSYDDTLEIVLMPVPRVDNMLFSVCDDVPFDTLPSANLSAIYQASYAWDDPQTPGIRGAKASAVVRPTSFAQQLKNLSDAIIQTEYRLVPFAHKAGEGACKGDTFSVFVQVNPTPKVSVVPPVETCSEFAFPTIHLHTTTPRAQFHWSALPNAKILGTQSMGTSDTIPPMKLINTTANTERQRFAVYALSEDGKCAGPGVEAVVTVQPTPRLRVSSESICDSMPFRYAASSPTANTSFIWRRKAQPEIENPAKLEYSHQIGDTLKNKTLFPADVPYEFILSANGCTFVDIFTLTVNPTPQADSIVGFSPDSCHRSIGSLRVYGLLKNTTYQFSMNQKVQDLRTNTSTEATVAGLPKGDYKDLFLSLRGCPSQRYPDLILKDPPPPNKPSLRGDTVCLNDSVFLFAEPPLRPDHFFWWGPDHFQSQQQNPVIAHAGTAQRGVYKAIVMKQNCSSDTAFTKVGVHDLPLLSVGRDTAICRDHPSAMALEGLPAGGTWKGIAVANNQFLPDEAPTGTHLLVYTYQEPTTTCVNSAQKKMTINPLPVFDFTFDTIHCYVAPLKISPLTTENLTYLWDFGDGNTGLSSGAPTSHKYHTTKASEILSIFALARNVNTSCVDTLRKTLNLIGPPPMPDFAKDKAVECAPVTVQFSVNPDDYQDPNLKFFWDFGDGQSSNELNPPPKTYHNKGDDTSFIIQLQVANACDVLTKKDTVFVLGMPLAQFEVMHDWYCSPVDVKIQNTSRGAKNTYCWTLGDTSFCDVQHPRKTFYTGETSTAYPLQLIAENRCGVDTMRKSILVKPNTLSAFFKTAQTMNCVGDTVFFINHSTDGFQAGNIARWSFGDGNVSDDWNAAHIYQTEGYVWVHLYVNNGCGFDTLSQQIYLNERPHLQILSQDRICERDTLHFDFSSNKSLQAILWDFGDSSTSKIKNPSHVFADDSNRVVTLWGKSADIAGCTHTVKKRITVDPLPKPIITVPQKACTPFLMNIGVDDDDYLYSWTINGELTSSKTIAFDNPTQEVASYAIGAEVSNHLGCKNQYRFDFQLYPTPTADFTYQTVYESPEQVEITNLSQHHTACRWILPNQAIAYTCDPPIVSVYNNQPVPLTLITKNHYDCEDTLSIEYVANLKGLFFPNAFIPESADPKVNQFNGVGIGLSQYQLNVYDLNHQMVFTTSSLDEVTGAPNRGWNGKNNQGKDLPNGTYLWEAKAVFIDKTVFPEGNRKKESSQKKSGYVLLIR